MKKYLIPLSFVLAIVALLGAKLDNQFLAMNQFTVETQPGSNSYVPLLNPGAVPTAVATADLGSAIQPYVVRPSGDTTGVTDSAAIATSIATYNSVRLAPGSFTISETIAFTADNGALTGSGASTVVDTVDNTFPVVSLIGADHTLIADIKLNHGLYGVDSNDSNRTMLSNVVISGSASHGFYAHDNCWNVSFASCHIQFCGGDGFNGLSPAANTINNIAFNNCLLEINDAHGISFSGNGLTVVGCSFEANKDTGLYIESSGAGNCGPISIVGNYFEDNVGGELEFKATSPFTINAVDVRGNFFLNSLASTDAILSNGYAASILYLVVDRTNYFSVAGGGYQLDLADHAQSARLDMGTRTQINVTNPERNRITYVTTNPTITEQFLVYCNADRTGAAATLFTIPAGSVLHSVTAKCTQAMNGSGTKSFEVGTATNADAYIDSVDFDPATLSDVQSSNQGGANDVGYAYFFSSATNIVATWTNTGGTPTAGLVYVYVTYTPGIYQSTTVAVPAP